MKNPGDDLDGMLDSTELRRMRLGLGPARNRALYTDNTSTSDVFRGVLVLAIVFACFGVLIGWCLWGAK